MTVLFSGSPVGHLAWTVFSPVSVKVVVKVGPVSVLGLPPLDHLIFSRHRAGRCERDRGADRHRVFISSDGRDLAALFHHEEDVCGGVVITVAAVGAGAAVGVFLAAGPGARGLDSHLVFPGSQCIFVGPNLGGPRLVVHAVQRDGLCDIGRRQIIEAEGIKIRFIQDRQQTKLPCWTSNGAFLILRRILLSNRWV